MASGLYIMCSLLFELCCSLEWPLWFNEVEYESWQQKWWPSGDQEQCYWFLEQVGHFGPRLDLTDCCYCMFYLYTCTFRIITHAGRSGGNGSVMKCVIKCAGQHGSCVYEITSPTSSISSKVLYLHIQVRKYIRGDLAKSVRNRGLWTCMIYWLCMYLYFHPSANCIKYLHKKFGRLLSIRLTGTYVVAGSCLADVVRPSSVGVISIWCWEIGWVDGCVWRLALSVSTPIHTMNCKSCTGVNCREKPRQVEYVNFHLIG